MASTTHYPLAFPETGKHEPYHLSLHDALPIFGQRRPGDTRAVERKRASEDLRVHAPDRLEQRQVRAEHVGLPRDLEHQDRKSTRLNSSHVAISYAVFCLQK